MIISGIGKLCAEISLISNPPRTEHTGWLLAGLRWSLTRKRDEKLWESQSTSVIRHSLRDGLDRREWNSELFSKSHSSTQSERNVKWNQCEAEETGTISIKSNKIYYTCMWPAVTVNGPNAWAHREFLWKKRQSALPSPLLCRVGRHSAKESLKTHIYDLQRCRKKNKQRNIKNNNNWTEILHALRWIIQTLPIKLKHFSPLVVVSCLCVAILVWIYMLCTFFSAARPALLPNAVFF